MSLPPVPASYRPFDRPAEPTMADLYAALQEAGLKPRRCGDNWSSLCPAHDDRSPSLSSSIQNGRLLLYCHAGCSFRSIIDRLRFAESLRSRPVQSDSPKRLGRGSVSGNGPSVDSGAHLPEPNPSVTREWHRICEQNPSGEPEGHERLLGIPFGGLRRLGAAWSALAGALAVPMLDRPDGSVIGVRLRADDGRKWAVSGSRNGLFCPTALSGRGPLFLPEGFTDTAAVAGLGLDAVGRPSCTGGRDLLRRFLQGNRRTIVVLGHNDKPNANGQRPGHLGASLLASELASDGRTVKVLYPPNGLKDARDWIRSGASAASVLFASTHRTPV